MGHIPKMQHDENRMSVRSNELIQNARYQLSVWEEDIITFMTTRLNIFADEFSDIEFYIQEFFSACGIKSDGAKNYAKFIKAIDSLLGRRIWIETIDKDGKEAFKGIHWISSITIQKHTGKVIARFDNDLKPYLLKLKKNFSAHDSIYSLHLRQEYDKRLYVYCKSRQFNTLEPYSFEINLTELKSNTGEGTLINGEIIEDPADEWKRFKEKKLDPAINRINKNTDINISYVTIKDGRKVVALAVTVTTKDSFESLGIVDSLKQSALPKSNTIPLLEEMIPQ